MTLWATASASVLGRDHAVLRKNRQDAAAAQAIGNVAFGFVSDGCGQGARTEVGALLTVAIARAEAAERLARGDELEHVARGVVAAVVAGLGRVAEAVARPARESFVSEHLLATLVGFVVRDRHAVLLAAGDGVLLSDSTCRLIDQGNCPSYPAYALFGARVPIALEHVPDVTVVAVATDGLDQRGLVAIANGALTSVARRLVLLQRSGALGDDGAVAIARAEVSPCAS